MVILAGAAGLGGAAVSVMATKEMGFVDFIKAGMNFFPAILFMIGLAGVIVGWILKWGKVLYAYTVYGINESILEMGLKNLERFCNDMNIKYTDKKCYTQVQVQELFQSVAWLSANYPERLKKALDHCETVYTAWDNERLVGLINAIDDGELTAYVHYLCVAPEYQGKGVGSRLLEQVKKKYKDYLYLILLAENKPLIDFYEKNDFKRIHENYVMEIRN